MKIYFDLKNTKDICYDYTGTDPYKPLGTIVASNRCKRCHNHLFIDCDSNGHYVECNKNS